jgi:hypothetical protein
LTEPPEEVTLGMIDEAKEARDYLRFVASTRMTRALWWCQSEAEFEEVMDDHSRNVARDEERILVCILRSWIEQLGLIPSSRRGKSSRMKNREMASMTTMSLTMGRRKMKSGPSESLRAGLQTSEGTQCQAMALVLAIPSAGIALNWIVTTLDRSRDGE